MSGFTQTITVVAKGTGLTFVDADRSGKPSIGDYEIGSTVYLNRTSAKAVGRGWVVCTQIDSSRARYECRGTAHFAGGDIVTAGPFDPRKGTFSLAVVGGTGVYAGVRGQQRTTWLTEDYSRSKVTFSFES